MRTELIKMMNDGRFKGLVQSEAIDGEAVITLTEEAVLFEKTGRSQTVPYSEIDAFSVVNYRLVIDAEGKRITVSQMGRDTDVLCQKLWDAYNARTLKAFFVEGAPSFEAEGEYRYRDDGGQSQGEAKLLLFPDCLCILPKSAEGRRVPLCFMEEPVLEGFTIKMTLDTGETYELIRSGTERSACAT
jgi:hypothetical protein